MTTGTDRPVSEAWSRCLYGHAWSQPSEKSEVNHRGRQMKPLPGMRSTSYIAFPLPVGWHRTCCAPGAGTSAWSSGHNVPAGFDIVDFKSARLHDLHCMSDVVKLRPRKNVFQYESSTGSNPFEVPFAVFCPAGYAVVQEDASVTKQ